MIEPTNPDFTDTPAARSRPSFGYSPERVGAEPCVTITTPFFDTDPDVFAETVRSVLGQSLQQWEWVIVDDRSTRPQSREALSQLSAVEPRVRVIRHEANRGVSAARNTAVEQARSEFVLQLGSNDLLEPTAMEKWLWFLISYPEYAFVNGFTVCFGDQEHLCTRGFHDGKAFLRENLAAGCSLVRRDAFDAVGGYDAALGERLAEWDFWLHCAAAGRWGATIPEYLGWSRNRGGGSSGCGVRLDVGSRKERVSLRKRYPDLRKARFPRIASGETPQSEIELDGPGFENALGKSRRRLLYIIPWAALGGAEQFNVDVVTQLGLRGWEVTIVTTSHGDHSWLPRLQALTPDVFALSHFLKPTDYPRFLRYMLCSRRPDAVLIGNSHFAYEALPYLRRIAAEVPIIDYCHMEEEQWLSGGYPRLSVDHRAFLDLHGVSSQYLKDWMVARGVEPERVKVCYTNVEPGNDADRPARAVLSLPEDVPIILYAGRIVDQKQPRVFAKTMYELHRRGYRFLALVIGDGDLLPWLRRFVIRKRLRKKVRFLGRQSNSRLRTLMSVADCVFIPSKHEGIALVFFEAMALGVAVVGADVGGQRELVTPDCGVLVERGDETTEVRRYADALGELLDDPLRRRTMGEAGRARIRTHFTLDRLGSRMEALLQQAGELAASQPRRRPSEREAHSAALDAIRTVSWFPPGPLFVPDPLSWRLRMVLLRFLSRVGAPVYSLSVRMGLHWVEPMKERAARALLPTRIKP